MITNRIYKAIWAAGLFTISLLLAPCSLTSCSQDEGNYDYHEIPEVTVEGLEEEYMVMLGTGYTLEITPDVTTTGNPDDLEYLWMLQTTRSAELNKTYVLGHDRNLTWSVDSTLTGSVEKALVYRVKDKTSGVTVTKTMTITPTSRLGSGIMLMTEDTEGHGVLQFISMATDTVIVYNALTEESGLPLPLGKPVNIIDVGRGSTIPGAWFWLSTEDDTWRLNPEFKVWDDVTRFSNNVLLTDEKYELGKNIAVDAFPHHRRTGEPMMEMNSRNNIFCCSNGLLFSGSNSFVDPMNIVWGEDEISLARPYIFYSNANRFQYVMFYDYVHERFLAANTGGIVGNSSVQKLTDTEGDVFPWNNKEVNRTMQYGQSTLNTDGGSRYGNSFALMRDKSTNDYYIYKFYKNSSSQTKMDCFSVGQIATDLTKAEFHAFSSTRTALYYTVGSKLYGLDYNKGNEKVYLIKDFGEPITYMRTDDQIEPNADYIYLATYSETNGGTFMKLQQGTNPDKLELTEVAGSKWTGLNKIVGWAWK